MYARIVTREEESARADGARRFVYIPMNAVTNIVTEERCCVRCVVDATSG